MQVIDLNGIAIFNQLQLEEALLRADDREFCLVNTGVSPAIVMGISGQPETLLNLRLLSENPLPVIKRYSGGGTVIVDPDTIFVTFICNSQTRGVTPFPHAIMEWSALFYRSFFQHETFQLLENDYVFGQRKCGGNAQYIQKQRWVHHTSFLWDFHPAHMHYLTLPSRRPSYRGDRPHEEFLCRLKDFYHCKKTFFEKLKTELLLFFSAAETPLESVTDALSRPHRKNCSLWSHPR